MKAHLYLYTLTGIIIGTMLGEILLVVVIYLTIIRIVFYQKRGVSSKHSLEKGGGGEQFRYGYKLISNTTVYIM